MGDFGQIFPKIFGDPSSAPNPLPGSSMADSPTDQLVPNPLFSGTLPKPKTTNLFDIPKSDLKILEKLRETQVPHLITLGIIL